jgi:hypothetical protein
MAYMGGMQSNFNHCADNGTNMFNPGNWNWSSGRTYTGIATGAISGAGMVGINVLPQIYGAIPNGALQAGINVGINGIGNSIDGDPFFQGAAIPAAMGFASGAISGYISAKEIGLNPLTGGGYSKALDARLNQMIAEGKLDPKSRFLLSTKKNNESLTNLGYDVTGDNNWGYTRYQEDKNAASLKTRKAIKSTEFGDILKHENRHQLDKWLRTKGANGNWRFTDFELIETRALYIGLSQPESLAGLNRAIETLNTWPNSGKIINNLIQYPLWP